MPHLYISSPSKCLYWFFFKQREKYKLCHSGNNSLRMSIQLSQPGITGFIYFLIRGKVEIHWFVIAPIFSYKCVIYITHPFTYREMTSRQLKYRRYLVILMHCSLMKSNFKLHLILKNICSISSMQFSLCLFVSVYLNTLLSSNLIWNKKLK